MTSKPLSCDIYFVRHGETDWNQMNRVQGHTDIPLNANGVSQASELGQKFATISFSAAFCSDLSRARHTAKLILNHREINLEESPALRERSAGQLEGQSSDFLDQNIAPFFLTEQALNKTSYLQNAWHPELETGHSVFQRVMNFLLPHVSSFSNQSILVVSHGGVLRSLLDHIAFTPLNRWIIANCGFIRLKIENESLHLMDSYRVTQKQIFKSKQ